MLEQIPDLNTTLLRDLNDCLDSNPTREDEWDQ
jgi:hypothetical protein